MPRTGARFLVSCGTLWCAEIQSHGGGSSSPAGSSLVRQQLQELGTLLTMRTEIEFDWRNAGSVTLEREQLRFPSVGHVPGIYRIDLGEGTVYVGEADRLQRRFQHYRTTGGDPETLKPNTDRRVHRAIAASLTVGTVSVDVCTEADVSIDGDRFPLNLAGKTERLLVESTAAVAAQRAGYRLENLAVNPRDGGH